MAIYLDDIKELKLYKNKFYLPINKKDKYESSVIFLLAKSIDDSIRLVNNPLTINNNFYKSYYIERDVSFYLNESNNMLPYDVINESLTKRERDSIPTAKFGIPDEQKYPLDTEEHIRSAIKLFGHAEEDKKHELARRILSAAKKYNIEIKDNTEVYKYATQTVKNENILTEEVEYDQIREFELLKENTGIINEDSYVYNLNGIQVRTYFDEDIDNILVESNNKYTSKFKKMLYAERMRTQKDLLLKYEDIKNRLPNIKYTYIKYDLYKSRNMYIDLSYYIGLFMKNNIYKLDIGLDLLTTIISKAIHDTRLDSNGYSNKTVFFPIKDWLPSPTSGIHVWDYTKTINPISALVRYYRTNKEAEIKNKFGGMTWVFITDKAYFKLNIDNLDKTQLPKFIQLIDKLNKNDLDDVAEDNGKDSTSVIVTKIIDKIEKGTGAKIKNLVSNVPKSSIVNGPETRAPREIISAKAEITNKKDKIKQDIVNIATKAAENSTSEDEAIENIDLNQKDKEWVAQLVDELRSEEGVNISKTRAERMSKLDAELLKKQINGKSIKKYIEDSKIKELEKDDIPVDSMNEDWKDIKYTNFTTSYNVDNDIVAIFEDMTKKTEKISITSIDKVDSSTSEDFKETWTIQFENINGKRFKVVFDVPKFIDGKFMKIKGNIKTIQGQLMLLPVIKTEDDTCQIVSNYNKIFIKRINPSNGTKTTSGVNILYKVLSKYNGKTIKVYNGDNSFICAKYNLPIEYKDLASMYSKIELPEEVICFNHDYMNELISQEKYKVYNKEDDSFVPISYIPKTKTVIYTAPDAISTYILSKLASINDKLLDELLTKTKSSDKLSYSIASILNTEIPVIVVMAYSEGLQNAMTKGGVEYEFSEKRPTHGKYIKFVDGYIKYDSSIQSSLLMSGLAYCNTEEYSIKDINKKAMWLDFLDDFGGRIKADGLDNFYDLMIDPITKEICEIYKLPTDYITILGYASSLLADTKYNKHVDITGNRIRTNEIVAGYVYKTIATAYSEYKNMIKRNKKDATLSVKQSAVIDKVLLDPTLSDLSVNTPTLEAEASNSLTFKGLSGMNSERSYTLDKRIYEDSMLGIVAASTGFAGNVGMTRYSTINANVCSSRGIIKKSNPDELNTLNMLSVTEAMTPFGTTHDDPMRVAMNFIQTSSHQMRVKRSHPNLVTTGMDEALPYLTSNIFSYKFKGKKGKVIDIKDDYIIYEDSETKQRGYVNLQEKVMKNSDGGFFVTVKLSPKVKKGQVIKYNDVLAYDKTSYSPSVGANKNSTNITYNTGTLAKIAIMPTDEAFEDSSIITETLSDSLTTEYCVKKEKYLPKDTNVYNVLSPGTEVQEGDPLIVFQNAFDQEDANALLKAITDEDLEAVSDLGRIQIRSKLTGILQDIRIYRTCELDELSPSLKKLVTAYENKIKKTKTDLKKYGISDTVELLEPDYKLNPEGKLKDTIDGVKIEFYLKCTDKMGIGDKLVYSAALKGVIKDVIKPGDEPYTDFRPDEHIEALLTTCGVDARMVASILISGTINKAMVELDRKCKDILGIKWKYLYNMDYNENK